MERVNGFLTEEQAAVHAAAEAALDGKPLRCTNCGAEEDFCQCKPTTFQPMTLEEWKDEVAKNRLNRKKLKRLQKAKGRLKYLGKHRQAGQRTFYDAGVEGLKKVDIEFDPDSWDERTITWKVCRHNPQHIIAGEGWGVWAGKRFNCEKRLGEFDLVLNLAGYTPRHAKHTIPVPELRQWESYTSSTPEIILDWPDGGTLDMPFQFWHDLLGYIIREKKKVLVFCLGGHGRTGTALACLMVAQGVPADEALDRIRTHYCDEAVETAVQEDYIARMEKDYRARG